MENVRLFFLVIALITSLPCIAKRGPSPKVEAVVIDNISYLSAEKNEFSICGKCINR